MNRTQRPEYKVWAGMKQRCSNPKSANWFDYGGRGITVCERWLKFDNFYADMGPRPNDEHSLERRDGDAGYEPSNCVWATADVQARNKRNTRWITYKGETLCLRDWAERYYLYWRDLQSKLNDGETLEYILAEFDEEPSSDVPAIEDLYEQYLGLDLSMDATRNITLKKEEDERYLNRARQYDPDTEWTREKARVYCQDKDAAKEEELLKEEEELMNYCDSETDREDQRKERESDANDVKACLARRAAQHTALVPGPVPTPTPTENYMGLSPEEVPF